MPQVRPAPEGAAAVGSTGSRQAWLRVPRRLLHAPNQAQIAGSSCPQVSRMCMGPKQAAQLLATHTC